MHASVLKQGASFRGKDVKKGEYIMGKSLKTKAFRLFVRKAMKKYVGNEDAYIEKRLEGRKFREGDYRCTDYQAPKGYFYEQKMYKGVPIEMLTKMSTGPLDFNTKKIIYVLHGGAYHASMTDLYNGVMERYSDGKYDVFAIDYRTAQKDPYPAALEDAVIGFEYLVSLGYNPSNIFLAGDSAGGGLALALAFKLYEMGKSIPKKYILSSPWIDLNAKYTKEQKKDDVLFGWGNVLEICAARYAGKHPVTDKYISPLLGDMGMFCDCDFYISVAKGEMLMEQGESLANKLTKAGARVTLDRLDSGVHDVITMYMLKSKECVYAWNRISSFLRRFMRF